MMKCSAATLAIAMLGLLGCGDAASESSDDDTDSITEALDVHCALVPTTARDAKARITGYIVADGVATTSGTYRLGGKSDSFDSYVLSLAQTAGIQMSKKGNALEVARSEIGNYYIAEAGQPYPFPILPALEGAPAVFPYDAQHPDCSIRHFLAAVLELDGAQGKPGSAKRHQVLDDPHPKKRTQFIAVWKAIGASSTHASGQSVLIDTQDDHVAQCLPNRSFGRVPGGAPPSGLCP
jgi:hypothetical protein